MRIGIKRTDKTVAVGFALLALAFFVLSPSSAHAGGTGARRPVLHDPNVTRVLVRTRLQIVREAARRAVEESRRKRSAGPADRPQALIPLKR